MQEEAVKQCPYCGRKIQEAAIRCSRCGESLQPDPAKPIFGQPKPAYGGKGEWEAFVLRFKGLPSRKDQYAEWAKLNPYQKKRLRYEHRAVPFSLILLEESQTPAKALAVACMTIALILQISHQDRAALMMAVIGYLLIFTTQKMTGKQRAWGLVWTSVMLLLLIVTLR